jgi:DNA polymerase-3 subunit delta'
MKFKDVIGQKELKEKLITAFNEGRVAHTQLFIGNEGSGTLPLAIAFAQYINCENKSDNDSCGECSSCKKFQKFAHPDLHFVFPTNKPEGFKDDPSSEVFYKEWFEYLQNVNGYALQNDWYSFLNIGKKQGSIYARDANNLIRALSFKNYEAKYKVAIIWMAERMDTSPANKLLKTLEEPPDNTLIFLIAERYELLLPTVRSRAQLVKVPKIARDDLSSALLSLPPKEEALPSEEDIENIVNNANGNWNRALKMLSENDDNTENFKEFREWLLLCYKLDYTGIFQFVKNLSTKGREKQKSFLQYGLSVVSDSLKINNGHQEIISGGKDEKDFLLKFAPFINEVNQVAFYEALNEAIYHIERNVHGAILFGDLSFTLMELLYKGRKMASKA